MGKEIDDPGIEVVRLRDRFGYRGLTELERTLGRMKADHLLVQYVPHAFGWKGMNLPFAAWVATRAWRFVPVWVMFHEVAFPFRCRPLSHTILSAVTRAMARLVAGAGARLFSSIAAWGPLIHRLCPRAKPVEWLPIPSNVPHDPNIPAVRSSPGTVIGHFGTYGPSTTELLEPTLLSLLSAHDRSATLLGRGGIDFRNRFIARYPHLSERVVALGELSSNELAARIRGCDVLLQPFIDGISSRRTSAMAGLSSGVPLVSNLGELSEPLWCDLGCIGLAGSPNPVELAAAAESVLSVSPRERIAMGQRSTVVYRERFGIDKTIACLRNPRERSCK
jgi:hypothetical protein